MFVTVTGHHGKRDKLAPKELPTQIPIQMVDSAMQSNLCIWHSRRGAMLRC